MTAIALAPVWRADSHQAVFRLILDAAARPGRVADLSAHLGGASAALGVLAAFCDATQTLADPAGRLTGKEWRFLDARPAAPEAAAFVLADGRRAPAFTPRLGALETPEEGATLVLAVDSLTDGAALALSGPGVPGAARLTVGGLASGWLEARARWCADFPMGVDLVLADPARVAVLPRTTRIAEV